MIPDGTNGSIDGSTGGGTPGDEDGTAPPPAWFTLALERPGESRTVPVAGCAIHYLRWGDRARPGLLFVPASGGHAHWFDHLGPLFADQFNVAAIDLSGCGDSGRRPLYTAELIVAEILAVARDAGMFDADAAPTFVGHSAGGQHAVRAARAAGEDLLGVVAVEGLRYARLAKDPAIAILEAGDRPAPRPAKVYPSLEEAVRRFRLAPAPLAPISAAHILEHIARHSFRETEGGWTSKFDPAQVAPVTLALDLTARLGELRCRSAAIYGEHTHIADETACAAIAALSGGRTAAFVMPGATHYPPLDSPLAFVAGVKGLVTAWLAVAANQPASGAVVEPAAREALAVLAALEPHQSDELSLKEIPRD